MSKQFQEWIALRKRLHAQERAFAQAHAAWQRGDQTDVETLSIQQSELRAMRALSRALLKKSLGVGEDTPDSGPDRPGRSGR